MKQHNIFINFVTSDELEIKGLFSNSTIWQRLKILFFRNITLQLTNVKFK